MKLTEITITADDLEAARQCPWSGKTCLIAQAAERTLNEYVLASSWNCVDALSRDFQILNGYNFQDDGITRLMALFDRGHVEDDEEIANLLPYVFTARRTCKYQLEPRAQEYYRRVFAPKSTIFRTPPSPLHILDIAVVEDFLVAGNRSEPDRTRV